MKVGETVASKAPSNPRVTMSPAQFVHAAMQAQQTPPGSDQSQNMYCILSVMPRKERCAHSRKR